MFDGFGREVVLDDDRWIKRGKVDLVHFLIQARFWLKRRYKVEDRSVKTLVGTFQGHRIYAGRKM